jgi:RNA chaperone Hfq
MQQYLRNLMNSGKQFALFFVNGYKGRYVLLDFDDDTLLVKDPNGKQMIIYLHAVTTIELG